MLSEKTKKTVNEIVYYLMGSAHSFNIDTDKTFLTIPVEQRHEAELAIYEAVDMCQECRWWEATDDMHVIDDVDLICSECKENRNE